ncbi:MAG TPA: hypothetical protein VKQ05_01120, partial [Gemmatimonadales bacterium]|nr:hypothetical protein [Gemmatimonadales bacterium]
MRPLFAGLLLAVMTACASGGGRGARPARTATAQGAPPPTAAAPAAAAASDTEGVGPQYPSTYKRHANPPVLIRNATIMTAAGQEIQGGSILFRDGRIVAVGTNVQSPTDAIVVDGAGKWVTP